MERVKTMHNLREPPPEKMTYEEFPTWCDEDTWAEWVDREVNRLKLRGGGPIRRQPLTRLWLPWYRPLQRETLPRGYCVVIGGR
jgi:hypothetical protein